MGQPLEGLSGLAGPTPKFYLQADPNGQKWTVWVVDLGRPLEMPFVETMVVVWGDGTSRPSQGWGSQGISSGPTIWSWRVRIGPGG
jgi:hypothetical protein